MFHSDPDALKVFSRESNRGKKKVTEWPEEKTWFPSFNILKLFNISAKPHLTFRRTKRHL